MSKRQRKHAAADGETCMQLQTYKTRFSCKRDMVFLPKSNIGKDVKKKQELPYLPSTLTVICLEKMKLQV